MSQDESNVLEERAATERFAKVFGALSPVQRELLGERLLSDSNRGQLPLGTLLYDREDHSFSNPVPLWQVEKVIERQAYELLEQAGYSRYDVHRYLRNFSRFGISW